MRQKLLHTATATAVRGRVYDVVVHQQGAMPEQLLAPVMLRARCSGGG
ncbi:hypothetical protein ACWGHM_39635 [Streptomyces sp. NPDC054904]